LGFWDFGNLRFIGKFKPEQISKSQNQKSEIAFYLPTFA
jgi:hypothetical protein